MDIQTSSKGFNLVNFLLVAGAVILALFVWNTFTQQKMYDAKGNEVGSTRTSGKMPKGRKGGRGAQRTAKA